VVNPYTVGVLNSNTIVSRYTHDLYISNDDITAVLDCDAILCNMSPG
jgi:hypothetical protein